jgi:hypothetical protein
MRLLEVSSLQFSGYCVAVFHLAGFLLDMIGPPRLDWFSINLDAPQSNIRDAQAPLGAFLTRDAQKITPSRREPCSSRTFLEVVVNLDEIRTERNSLCDNGVDFASVSRNHERLITGNVARNNYEMHRPRAVWVDSVGAALVLKSGRPPLNAVNDNNVLLDKIARTVERYDPNPVLQSSRGGLRVLP